MLIIPGHPNEEPTSTLDRLYAPRAPLATSPLSTHPPTPTRKPIWAGAANAPHSATQLSLLPVSTPCACLAVVPPVNAPQGSSAGEAKVVLASTDAQGCYVTPEGMLLTLPPLRWLKQPSLLGVVGAYCVAVLSDSLQVHCVSGDLPHPIQSIELRDVAPPANGAVRALATVGSGPGGCVLLGSAKAIAVLRQRSLPRQVRQILSLSLPVVASTLLCASSSSEVSGAALQAQETTRLGNVADDDRATAALGVVEVAAASSATSAKVEAEQTGARAAAVTERQSGELGIVLELARELELEVGMSLLCSFAFPLAFFHLRRAAVRPSQLVALFPEHSPIGAPHPRLHPASHPASHFTPPLPNRPHLRGALTSISSEMPSTRGSAFRCLLVFCLAGFSTTNYLIPLLLLATHYVDLLLTTYYLHLLLTTCYCLLNACYLPVATYCILLATYYSLLDRLHA